MPVTRTGKKSCRNVWHDCEGNGQTRGVWPEKKFALSLFHCSLHSWKWKRGIIIPLMFFLLSLLHSLLYGCLKWGHSSTAGLNFIRRRCRFTKTCFLGMGYNSTWVFSILSRASWIMSPRVEIQLGQNSIQYRNEFITIISYDEEIFWHHGNVRWWQYEHRLTLASCLLHCFPQKDCTHLP